MDELKDREQQNVKQTPIEPLINTLKVAVGFSLYKPETTSRLRLFLQLTQRNED